MAGCDHTIHGRHHHNGWDRSIPPALTVAPGESVEFECLDASGGQLTKTSVTADVPNLSFDAINPVTGPVLVDGAQPRRRAQVSRSGGSRPRASAGRPTSRALGSWPTSSPSPR